MSEAQINECIDCGAPTSGLRCRPCNGKAIQRHWAQEMEAHDVALLQEVADGLTPGRLAVRLGKSRVWAYRTLSKARRRQAVLRQMQQNG